MAANSHRVGSSSYGGAAPYRSRDGLSTRPVGASEEIQLRIDPLDLDDEITGLHRQVRRLKHVAEDIGTEVKYQKNFVEELQMTMIKAQAGVKNNLRRLNQSIIQSGSNHIIHVILFALVCFFVVYLGSKMFRK
ncbi:hypothetical protein VNO78_31071 [Psophocarpus tetragonolobus]|uniref:t-SNARE coiled-coil homology domain-containing protein n=1 Tax=Psophocarpus tetragonolobus TaxID=3891 RepID=A0AAN9RYB3_PSOTE